jgi:MFS family permease
LFATATAVTGCGVAALALATAPPWVFALVALTGLGEGPQLTAVLTVRQREAPEGLRGQIFTTGASLKITAGAAGAALAGVLAQMSVGAALLGYLLPAGPRPGAGPPGTDRDRLNQDAACWRATAGPRRPGCRGSASAGAATQDG